MNHTPRFQETLRRLAIFHEGLVEAGFGGDLINASSLDAKTVALLQVAASVAMGSSAVCLQWSTARALAAGATKDEITDVLLAIVPMAGLGRIVSAAPGVATALVYAVETAMEGPKGQRPPTVAAAQRFDRPGSPGARPRHVPCRGSYSSRSNRSMSSPRRMSEYGLGPLPRT